MMTYHSIAVIMTIEIESNDVPLICWAGVKAKAQHTQSNDTNRMKADPIILKFKPSAMGIKLIPMVGLKAQ